MRYNIPHSNGEVAIFDVNGTVGVDPLTPCGLEVTDNSGSPFQAQEGRWTNIYRAPNHLQVIQCGSRVWGSVSEAMEHTSSNTMTYIGTARLYRPTAIIVPTVDPLDTPIQHDHCARITHGGTVIRLGWTRNAIRAEIQGTNPPLFEVACEGLKVEGWEDYGTGPSQLLRRNRWSNRCRSLCLHFAGRPTHRQFLEVEARIRRAFGFPNRRNTSRTPGVGIGWTAPNWTRTRSYGPTEPNVVVTHDGSVEGFDQRVGGIGVELEIELCSMAARSRFNFSNAISEDCRVEFKHDGSLRRGIELCPQPFADFSTALHRLSGAWRYLPSSIRNAPGPIIPGSKAGTHIHVSGEHDDLPPGWYDHADAVMGLVKDNWDLFKQLGQFSSSQESYKRPDGGRGWWNSCGGPHVEFRGFGLCRDGIDLTNYVAIIKASLWAAKRCEEHNVAQGDGYMLGLFLKKLKTFGWVNRFNIELPKVVFNHDDFLDHEGYCRQPHKQHGLVLGKKGYARLLQERENARIIAMTHTCALPPDYVPPEGEWVPMTHVDQLKVGMTIRCKRFNSQDDFNRADQSSREMGGAPTYGDLETYNKFAAGREVVLTASNMGPRQIHLPDSWHLSFGCIELRSAEIANPPHHITTIHQEYEAAFAAMLADPTVQTAKREYARFEGFPSWRSSVIQETLHLFSANGLQECLNHQRGQALTIYKTLFRKFITCVRGGLSDEATVAWSIFLREFTNAGVSEGQAILTTIVNDYASTCTTYTR